ncbi:occlusion-derived virus envelope protein ODV-E66 [Spodoptera littoralis nucleopolyhedrovirus]|uniref:Occlusion-derived virus envelope protein ODV-E66 n=1 Tax=Spodoptera littoralis nuclear polyhedrosis virus TaxID=10456 RepID=M1JNY2_NPVSL|nr:occlusion-derived virus envelope protein ODV-E66 [Spodoptera littoralis nucleopolyhedrovirus]AGE89948.1 occlusion-derived virus envelope protein ODV-E66 [Spodoptera littoralis nucleopolyhedrovirus]
MEIFQSLGERRHQDKSSDLKMYTVLIVVLIVVVVLVIVFSLNNNGTPMAKRNRRRLQLKLFTLYDQQQQQLYNFLHNSYYDDDLARFENYYLNTLKRKFLQKSDKIASPTRLFSNDGNMFVDLEPWSNASHFGIAMHTLIGYGVRFRDPDDALYLDSNLADNLMIGIMLVYNRLPFSSNSNGSNVNSPPWGNDWYHFNVTMPECMMNTCIVLRGFYNLSPIVHRVFNFYIAKPESVRTCVAYVYGQMLRGQSLHSIRYEHDVQKILNKIRYSLVPSGNGIHRDYVFFDRTDVRAYQNLIDSYFTFDYYNHLFGGDTVNMFNVNNSINIAGSRRGLINPALYLRSVSHHSNSLTHMIDYANGVYSADFSKVLTYRSEKFFGSVVGNTDQVAYYEADESNDKHAPLWAMIKKIWAEDGRIVPYRNATLGIDSGVILTGGNHSIPTTGPGTTSFVPTFAYTAICATDNAGLMITHSRFEELGIEFYSYTLYHKRGMVQVYDRIKTFESSSSSSSSSSTPAKCVILTRDLTQDTNEPRWTAASNTTKTYNRVSAVYHNIANNPYTMPSFTTRIVESSQLQILEQIVSADHINKGIGAACFSLVHADDASLAPTDVSVSRITNSAGVGGGGFMINANNGMISCAIDFPYAAIKDVESRQVTINSANNFSRESHRLSFVSVSHIISQLSLNIHNLKSSTVNRNGDAFYFDNAHGNQFRFTY